MSEGNETKTTLDLQTCHIPTAISDGDHISKADLDIDRKLGDTILKSLTKKKQVVRIQHNLFIESQILTNLVNSMKDIIKKDGFIEVKNFKEHYTMSRKYLIAYLDYLDNFSEIKKENQKRVFT